MYIYIYVYIKLYTYIYICIYQVIILYYYIIINVHISLFSFVIRCWCIQSRVHMDERVLIVCCCVWEKGYVILWFSTKTSLRLTARQKAIHTIAYTPYCKACPCFIQTASQTGYAYASHARWTSCLLTSVSGEYQTGPRDERIKYKLYIYIYIYIHF